MTYAASYSRILQIGNSLTGRRHLSPFLGKAPVIVMGLLKPVHTKYLTQVLVDPYHPLLDLAQEGGQDDPNSANNHTPSWPESTLTSTLPSLSEQLIKSIVSSALLWYYLQNVVAVSILVRRKLQ